MGLIPKWLRDWIASLMPKQESTGSGSVQMGTVQGPVQNVTHVTHHHFYAPSSVQAENQSPAKNDESRPAATAAHKEVLTLMKPLDRKVRVRVLDFMRREFQTAMVVELTPEQLRRLRSYVETVRRNEERGRERT
ncbi:hypothetical protein [Paracidovorax anthurii]|uniref:hypothetical protein n=1 Tax=Paracidovorax anthurii TaxID=78229 RepID=UPI0011BF5E9D|nr:hypothetical protein [Paracidovorax anthurii]